MMSIERAASMAGLWASIHVLRIMANRGLVSPNEVETVNDAIMESFETLGSQEMAASVAANLAPAMAEVLVAGSFRWHERVFTSTTRIYH